MIAGSAINAPFKKKDTPTIFWTALVIVSVCGSISTIAKYGFGSFLLRVIQPLTQLTRHQPHRFSALPNLRTRHLHRRPEKSIIFQRLNLLPRVVLVKETESVALGR